MSSFLEWVRSMLHTAEPDLPMGEVYNAVGWTPAIIPELVSGVTVAETLGVPGTIDRRDVPSNEEFLSLMPDPNDPRWGTVTYSTRSERVQPVIDQNGEVVDTLSPFYIPGVSQAGIRYMEDNEGEEDMGWYTDLDEKWFGGMLPGGAPPTGGGYIPTWPDAGFGPDFEPTYDPGLPAPTIPSSPAMPSTMAGPGCGPAEDPMKGCVLKKVCGQWRWVKQKRRRRKQLVTKSDAQGLAVLKGLVGVGKTMDTWIATHS